MLLSFFDLETVRADGELLVGVQVTHAEGLNQNTGDKVAMRMGTSLNGTSVEVGTFGSSRALRLVAGTVQVKPMQL